MPTFAYISNGQKKTFRFPASTLPKFVRVDGIVVTPQATTDSSITLAEAPYQGFSVEVMYAPVRAVVDRTPGGGRSGEGGQGLELLTIPGRNYRAYLPEATVYNPAESIAPPVITFHGDLSDNLVFQVDPTWSEAAVYPNGSISASNKIRS